MTFIPVETMDDVIHYALRSERADGQASDGMGTTSVAEPLPIAAESPAQREPEPEMPPMDLPHTPDTQPPA